MINVYAPMATGTLAAACAIILIVKGDFAGAGAWLIFSTMMVMVSRFESILQYIVVSEKKKD